MLSWLFVKLQGFSHILDKISLTWHAVRVRGGILQILWRLHQHWWIFRFNSMLFCYFMIPNEGSYVRFDDSNIRHNDQLPLGNTMLGKVLIMWCAPYLPFLLYAFTHDTL